MKLNRALYNNKRTILIDLIAVLTAAIIYIISMIILAFNFSFGYNKITFGVNVFFVCYLILMGGDIKKCVKKIQRIRKIKENAYE